MPGHVTSWLTAYPELGYQQVQTAERFGVHAACLDPASDKTYEVIGSILDTLVDIFPDPCVHIGGDEVSPRWWSEDPKVQALMAAEGLADVRAVQGYFNRRVASMVADRGRQVVAWDEVIDAGMEEGWIIQAWRGVTMRDRVTVAGNRVLLSAPYYLDLHYPTDIYYGFDPAAAQSELIEREDALITDPRFEHIAGGLRWTEQWREGAVDIAAAESRASGDAGAGQESLLLGAEACLWSELVTADVLDLRLFSRLPALAERFWSAAALTNTEDVSRRQDLFLDHQLPLAGIDLAAQTEFRWREAGIDKFWSELVRMLEPIKWYGRLLGMKALAARIAGTEMPQARPYDLASPLNQLIDHLPVESRSARELAALCLQAAEEGAAGQSALALLRQRLQMFAQLGAASAEAPQGLGPLAQKLAGLGELIEHRLDGQAAAPDQLRELIRPEDEFVLALPPALWRWLVGS
jgi:hexosaminidase